MASWSIYMRDPAHFGFRDILSTLPAPDIREYTIPITSAQREMMHAFQTKRGTGMLPDRLGVQERSKFSQIAKGFLYETTETKRKAIPIDSNKPAFVADLIRQDYRDGRQVLGWTVFDAESELLSSQLRDLGDNVGYLDGSMSDNSRDEIVKAFKSGSLGVLISKPSLIGYGMNFQNCTSNVFSGFDDSFERMYQAIRRAYRFGQKETVRVHVPYIRELEGMVFDNIRQKEAQFIEDVTIQEKYYREAIGL